VKTCVAAGAPGITVHPRQDQRHIRPDDVHEISALLAHLKGPSGRRIEFNIEGDPGPELIDLVLAIKPTQCTLVPTTPGEITSHAAGRRTRRSIGSARSWDRCSGQGIRVSVFVEPEPAPIEWAARLKADRDRAVYGTVCARVRGGRRGGTRVVCALRHGRASRP
jgi:pyridoxine 5-phosphate synthase